MRGSLEVVSGALPALKRGYLHEGDLDYNSLDKERLGIHGTGNTN